jgi:nitrogenase molybdenum-iron protein alpha/beta subunit
MYPGALLAQECCSFQGMTEVLAPMGGRLVVLIHADRDCTNVLHKVGGYVRADLAHKFVATNLTEEEMTAGQGPAKLARALEVVARELAPELIVVLATCPTVMIGDDVVRVARAAEAKLGVRVAAAVTHGLKTRSPAQVIDECYTMLARAAVRATGDVSRRVNLVGMDLYPRELAEMRAVLAGLGLELNAVVTSRAALGDFARLGEAALNAHPDPMLLRDFDAHCQAELGLATVHVPLPFGVAATDAFYAAIAAAAGVPRARVTKATKALRAPAARAVAALRDRLASAAPARGLRCAYNLGSVRSFDLRRIALEELGGKPLFDELGFAATLFIQGPTHEENRARVAGVLQALGVAEPFVLFPDPGQLARSMAPGAFDLFYGADFVRNELSKLGLPAIHHVDTRMGYRAVAHNLELVERALASHFYQLFGAASPT